MGPVPTESSRPGSPKLPKPPQPSSPPAPANLPQSHPQSSTISPNLSIQPSQSNQACQFKPTSNLNLTNHNQSQLTISPKHTPAANTATQALDASPSRAIQDAAAPPLVGGRDRSRVVIKNKGRVLDLFSGTGSVTSRMEVLGYSVVSLDLDHRVGPAICEDFMQWDYTKFLPGHFKIICASVPCAEYSLAKTTAPRDLERADALVKRVLKLVQYFSPKIWWIENPRTGLLK